MRSSNQQQQAPPQLRRLLSSTGVSSTDLLSKKSSNMNSDNITTTNNKNDEKRLIAADHDDEAEDQIINRNPRDWPFPSFEPAGEDAARRKKQQLKKARETMMEVQRAPAVVVINAPHETDRPSWKAAITVKHVDPPPLDLRTEKPEFANNRTVNNNNNNSNYATSPQRALALLEDDRPRWISIAQTKLVSGCPSRGIPLHEFENPSAISARKWEKPHHHNKTHLHNNNNNNNGSSTSRATSLASNTNNNNNNNLISSSKKRQQQQQPESDITSSRSLKKLLNQMDSQAAGTRSHQPREQKVLSFLRESSKAQQSIKRHVLNPGEHDEDDFHGEDGKNMLASSLMLGGPAPFLVSKKRKEQYIESARQQERARRREVEILVERENDLKTFEDFVQPKEKDTNNNNNNNNNNSSLKLPQLGASAGTTAFAKSGNSGSASMMMTKMNQSARSGSGVDQGNSSVNSTNNNTPQKILVRLPKVGLSLFSVSQKM